jgi:hypothetical protein
MVLTRIESLEDARRRADEDEAVRSGLLSVRVRPWRVVTRGEDSTPPAGEPRTRPRRPHTAS